MIKVESDNASPRLFLLPLAEIRNFLRHVFAALPNEASGLLLGHESGRHTVLSFAGQSCSDNKPHSFRIGEAVIRQVAASLRGSKVRICGCAHSHTRGRAFPSPRDCESAKGDCLLWMIYSVPRRDLNLFEWDGKAFGRVRFRITR